MLLLTAEGDVDLLEADIRDPHAVAGLLKTFLRELPSSLLTRDLHMLFLAVMGMVINSLLVIKMC
jgi:RalA-binding protein 1